MRATYFLLPALILPSEAIRLKFRYWFPQYEQYWINASAVCRPELIDYYQGNQTACKSPCACAADCILENITGTMQSNLASAQVLLGLTPAIMVYFGPTIAEVSVLSTQKPLLSILLALGSPAVSLGRIFGAVDIREPLSRPIPRLFTSFSKRLSRHNLLLQNSIETLSYVGALAAIANNAYNSIYLDYRTISGWRCSIFLMPLIWSLLAAIVHLWGIIGIRFRSSPRSAPSIRSVFSLLTPREVLTGHDNIVSESLFWLASLSAIIHMIFGVLVLSSLVFIGAREALQVFVMYASSAFLCQFIVLLELGRIRWKNAEKVSDYSFASKEPLPSASIEMSRATTI